jgi:spermidine/putrescine transport system substrate-binding protein
MKTVLKAAAAAAALFIGAGAALADGELHIYNFGDYTSPDLIKKFEDKYKVKVTLDSYDSNETMMSKVRAGNSGYDIVVPSDYAVKVMSDEGLLEKTEPNTMENFKNLKPDFVHLYFDDGRHYTVPWQYGLTAFTVDTAKYKGDINTYAILFNTPDELKGKVNMLDDVNSTMHAAERYLGVPRCSANKEDLKKVSDLLMAAKPNWKTFSYDTMSLLTNGDVIASMNWNGYSYRARQKVATMTFAHPKEGIEGFMDNVAVLKGAPNLENAKLFQNFVMDPEMAGLASTFAGYDNGIAGSDKFMPPELANSPEIKYPADAPKPEIVPPCAPEVVEVYNQIWTELKK